MNSTVIVFSHRGASHLYPENTLPAFREAIRLGADGLELDVQLTKDYVPIVFHDEYLHRTTNGKGLVRNHTLKEIKRLSAGGWFHPQFHAVKVPTLFEVLKRAKPYSLLLNIEMKNLIFQNEHLEQEIIRRVQHLKMTDRVILSSFNTDSIERVKQLDPRIKTGLLYFGKLAKPWKMAESLGADYLQPPILTLSEELVEQSNRLGIKVCPYHVNKWTEIQLALKCKVNALVTMYPERVKNL
jgi:glycerophosphoryl diester phosphodiesterase